MTIPQRRSFMRQMRRLKARKELNEFHHGDCVGADSDADHIVRLVSPRAKIHIHPPEKDFKRAHTFIEGDTMYPAKPYLDRNHDIVDAVDILFATPKTNGEVIRSGTWATIRYARKQGKKVVLIRPDGTIA